VDIDATLLRSAKATKFSKYTGAAPNNLGFQLANTWPEITGRDVYAMVSDVKKPQNSDFLRWLQLSKRQVLTFLPGV